MCQVAVIARRFGVEAPRNREGMGRQMRYSENICPRFQYAIGLLSKRWTGLIVKVLLDGPARFNELAEKLQVVGDRVLAERLRELEAQDIITRQVYPSTPVRIEYSLTDRGKDLAPVVDSIEDWSHRWLPEDFAHDQRDIQCEADDSDEHSGCAAS